MQDFSDEHFEELATRYYHHVLYQYQKHIDAARDKDFVNEMLLFGRQFFEGMKRSDYEQALVNSFEYQYRIGVAIVDILEAVEPIRQEYLAIEAHELKAFSERTVKCIYYKLFYFIKTPLLKSKITYDNNGHVIEHINYTYDFSREQVSKLRKAKGRQEKLTILTQSMCKEDYVVQETAALTRGSVSTSDVDKRVYFKFFVKYAAEEQLNALIEQQLNGDNTLEATQNDIAQHQEDDDIENIPFHDTVSDAVNTEYTDTRQVLAVYYLLSHLNLEEAFLNKADFGRLVHLLAGTPIPTQMNNGRDSMDKSVLYKRVKALFTRNNKPAMQDLQFVLERFEKLATHESTGLNELVGRIKKDIDLYKTS